MTYRNARRLEDGTYLRIVLPGDPQILNEQPGDWVAKLPDGTLLRVWQTPNPTGRRRTGGFWATNLSSREDDPCIGIGPTQEAAIRDLREVKIRRADAALERAKGVRRG